MKVGKVAVKMLIFLIVLASFATIVLADDWHWECMTYGDCLSGGYCCWHQRCQACVKDGFTGLFKHCADKTWCSWGNGTIDLDPPVITINIPVNGSVFGSRYVDFDIDLDEVSSLYVLDSAEEWRGYMRWCSNCNSYSISRSFDEGAHTLFLKAIDLRGNEGTAEVFFRIDSEEPEIRSTRPKQGEYVNTEFVIEYDEQNLVSITLHYRSWADVDYTDVTKTDCPSGKNQECVFEVTGLPQGELYYYFTVTDIADTSVDSREVMVIIDTEAPEMDVFSPVHEAIYNERSIGFDIEVNEEVEIGYVDNSETRPRYGRLCSNCVEYTKSKSFRDGVHELVINATDHAGNRDSETISFTIDSTDPKIRRTYPSRGEYVNTDFIVEYDEENVERVTLYYKEQGAGDYSEVDGVCPSGEDQECIITVTGLEEGELWYYFEIQDIAGNTDESRETQVNVDTEPPLMTLTLPVDGIYSEKKIEFDIEVSDDNEVEIGYTDTFDSKYTKLCSRCTEYKKSKSLKDGEHQLTITATDPAGNSIGKPVTFTIDSTDPRIKSIEPRSRKYTNGVFSVEYDENNVEKLTLFYSQDPDAEPEAYTPKEAGEGVCPDGKNQECIITLEEAEMDQGELWFYFVMQDIAGNTDESRVTQVNVDTEAPDMTVNKPVLDAIYESRAEFDITISEDVELGYVDNGGRYKRICSRCDSYDYSRYFSDGLHALTITATDPAGNTDEFDVSFTII